MKEMSFMTRDKSGQYIIRNIRKSEIGLLKDFLYEAVFVPEGVESPPRDICRTSGAAGVYGCFWHA